MCLRTHPTVAAELERARQRSAQLSQDLYGIPVSSSLRSRMAATCFAIAMDHCDGIAILLAHQPPAEASAFALVRSVFDTYVRGLWLANGASDADVRDFSTGELRPTMPSMLKAIGEAPTAGAKSLSHSYDAHSPIGTGRLATIIARQRTAAGDPLSHTFSALSRIACRR